MTRDEWNALVARYTAALTTRANTHDPALLPARDMAVADALLAVLDSERRIIDLHMGRVDGRVSSGKRGVLHLHEDGKTLYIDDGPPDLSPNVSIREDRQPPKPVGPPNTVRRECDEPPARDSMVYICTDCKRLNVIGCRCPCKGGEVIS